MENVLIGYTKVHLEQILVFNEKMWGWTIHTWALVFGQGLKCISHFIVIEDLPQLLNIHVQCYFWFQSIPYVGST